MPFRDSYTGTTHSFGDGCGMPEHNDPMPNSIVHKDCGTISTLGTYDDGTTDYLCRKCDVTFINDEEQTIIS